VLFVCTGHHSPPSAGASAPVGDSVRAAAWFGARRFSARVCSAWAGRGVGLRGSGHPRGTSAAALWGHASEGWVRVLGVADGRDDTAFVSAGSGWPVGVTPPVLFERDAEVEVIVDLVWAVGRGSGAVVLVEAAAGLGKSVLLDHAAGSAAGAGLLVLRARGHQLERAFGWGVVRSLFEGLLRGGVFGLAGLLDGPVALARAVLLDGQGARDGPAIGDGGFEILHALYWLVVRLGERRPLVLVVDDAHWADVPSLRFLAHLQARISDRPVGVVVGARPPDRDADRVLGVLATDPGTRLLRLRSLSVEAVEQLVRVRWPAAPAEFCRHCGELTAGNPLQLGELLRAVEARGGPPEVGGLGEVAAAAARFTGAGGAGSAGGDGATGGCAGRGGRGVRGRGAVAPGCGARADRARRRGCGGAGAGPRRRAGSAGSAGFPPPSATGGGVRRDPGLAARADARAGGSAADRRRRRR
jgi:AAA ATPase domain